MLIVEVYILVRTRGVWWLPVNLHFSPVLQDHFSSSKPKQNKKPGIFIVWIGITFAKSTGLNYFSKIPSQLWWNTIQLSFRANTWINTYVVVLLGVWQHMITDITSDKSSLLPARLPIAFVKGLKQSPAACPAQRICIKYKKRQTVLKCS